MFLIRSRNRAITGSSSKQSHMEQSTENQSKPICSFLKFPKFLGGFLSKNMWDHHHLDINSASPTSILDTKQFCNNESRNHHPPIGYHKDLFIKPSSSMEKKIKHPYEHKGIGLALEEEEEDEDEDFDSSFSKPNRRKMVLFGAKLKKVQVLEPCLHDVEQSFPSTNNNNTSDLKSPSDFGIKTKNLQLLPCYDSTSVKKSPQGLSLNEMELSEEYTCVIKHGNDPKIIHIFDDMIVESFHGEAGNLFDMKKGNTGNSLLLDLLGFCYTCKVKLGDDKDIYMFRGEKSFCSPECRFQEMIKEEDEGK